jgi:uncharacterized Tic20 family protein
MSDTTPTNAASVPELPELPSHPFINSRNKFLLYLMASSILVCAMILMIAFSIYEMGAANTASALFDVVMSLLLAALAGMAITFAIIEHTEVTMYKEDLAQQELEDYESQMALQRDR